MSTEINKSGEIDGPITKSLRFDIQEYTDASIRAQLTDGITEWNPSFTKNDNSIDHFALALIAPRKQGKSIMIRHLYTKYNFINLFDHTIVMSNSLANAESPDFYADFVPGNLQFWEYRADIIEKIFAMQHRRRLQTGSPYNILIIFDDCVSQKMKNADDILQVFVRGRNSGISIIFATQTPTLMNKNWRTNLDYAILLFEYDSDNRELNINNLLTPFYPSHVGDSKAKKRREIDEIYLAITNDPQRPFQALVSNIKERKLCRYRAALQL